MNVVSFTGSHSIPPRRLVPPALLSLQFHHHLPQESLIPLICMLCHKLIRLLPYEEITDQFPYSSSFTLANPISAASPGLVSPFDTASAPNT